MTMPTLARLRSDRRGLAAVEFAIVAPALLLLICGAIELGHLYMVRSVLEGSTVEAARLTTATLETSENDRDVAMRAYITKAMASFPVAPGQSIAIDTKVYRDFNAAYPENFEDLNNNGVYDPPAGAFGGEPFTDRNKNGKWDPRTEKGGKLGGPGDVVSYTVLFPARLLFDVPLMPPGLRDGMTLSATAVVRNESAVTLSGS